MSRSEANEKVSHAQNECVTYANSAAVSAGELIYIDGIGAAMAVEAADASADCSYKVRGTVKVPITSGVTISQGNKVYWDVSANTANLAGASALTAGDFFLGTAVANGSAAGGYVEVDLGVDLGVEDTQYKTITASDTYEIEDHGIIVDATSAAINVTLPATSTARLANRKCRVVVKNADNAVRVVPASTNDTIMGATSAALDVREGAVFVPVGTDWIAEANAYNIATAGIAADAVDGTKIADDAVSLEHLDTGITPAYICVGYGTKTSAGTGGTFAVSGALTSDFVIPVFNATGWTQNATSGVSVDRMYVSGAGVVTYVLSGTATAGTNGAIGGAVMRAAA